MYTDYPTIYETTINENLIYFIILGVILLIILIITFLALAKVFKKANRSGISAIIPIYNILILLEITNSSKWYLLFLLIPGINIIFSLFLMLNLAKTFRKSKLFAVGLTFLPFIFLPILGFGKSEYIGINLAAMEGKTTVVDIPRIIEPEEKNLVVHEQKDTSLKNIDISIGGGVYQKEYTNTLLRVDQNQTIPNKNNDFIDNTSSIPNHTLNDNIDSSKLSFIAPIEEEKKLPEEPKDISTSFINQINSVEEKKEAGLQNLNNLTICNSIKNVENTKTQVNELQKISGNNQPSFTINPEVQSLTNKQLRENKEFISCPKCGATIKSNAKVCFLCGKRFN